jgi:hypothetical protein
MNEEVGSIREIMIDVPSGRVAYAVLGVGGFLGFGERLFAIPWQVLTLDEDRKCFLLDVDKNRLQNAPGFDKDNWPDMADVTWASGINSYWNVPSASVETPVGNGHQDEIGLDASRRYDRDVESFPEGEGEEKAREARNAIDSPEGVRLREAEEIGKSRAK